MTATKQPEQMHTTRHDSALGEATTSADGPFFQSVSSLSERELIATASDLATVARAEESRAYRAFDIVLASAMLLFLAPVLLLTALAIAVVSPGPVIFKQTRIGMNGRTFGCLKFRTMRIDAEEHLAHLLETKPELREEWARDQKLSSDPRITPIGSFLRLSSIDELPQLINVIRGDMSLVGPRPIVEDEALRYGRYITSYFSVRPGLTGIWQISGRNDTSYRRRVAADVLFARTRSFGLILKILLATIPAVLNAEGAR